MHYFLNYGRQLTQEEMDSLEEDERAIKKQYPTLDQVWVEASVWLSMNYELSEFKLQSDFQRVRISLSLSFSLSFKELGLVWAIKKQYPTLDQVSVWV